MSNPTPTNRRLLALPLTVYPPGGEQSNPPRTEVLEASRMYQ